MGETSARSGVVGTWAECGVDLVFSGFRKILGCEAAKGAWGKEGWGARTMDENSWGVDPVGMERGLSLGGGKRWSLGGFGPSLDAFMAEMECRRISTSDKL